MLSARTALFAIAALCGFAAASRAAGINLYWNDCSAGASATTNRDFACNTNIGFNDLYVSYSPPPEITAVEGVEQVIDVQSATSALPDWWQFKNAGTCRLTALTLLLNSPGSCIDPWVGQPTAGGIAAYQVFPNPPGIPPNGARILSIEAVPAGTPMPPLDPTKEYSAAVIRISNVKTVGPTACGGCSTPVCMVLNYVGLYPPGAPTSTNLYTPISNNFVSWQGAVNGGLHTCLAATPAQNHTWGQIKTIYR